jgi:hypothetical protein
LNGPNFDLMFYITTISVIAGVMGVLATVLYSRYLVTWTTRSIVQLALCLKMVGGGFDLSIARGWNKSALHISDHAFFVFGDAMAAPISSMLVTIALTVLLSNLVHVGKATTSYAIMNSLQYLGMSTSRILGMLISTSMGIHANRYTGCNFDNFSELIVLTKMVSVMLAISVSYVLVPNIAFGSPRERCCGRRHEA